MRSRGVSFLICIIDIYLRSLPFFHISWKIPFSPLDDFFNSKRFSGVFRFHSFSISSAQESSNFGLLFGKLPEKKNMLVSVYILVRNVEASSKSNLLKLWIMFAELWFYIILGLVMVLSIHTVLVEYMRFA